ALHAKEACKGLNLSQRLLEVVTGDERKALKLAVATLQVGRAARDSLLGYLVHLPKRLLDPLALRVARQHEDGTWHPPTVDDGRSAEQQRHLATIRAREEHFPTGDRLLRPKQRVRFHAPVHVEQRQHL